jgi:hypothetical protein
MQPAGTISAGEHVRLPRRRGADIWWTEAAGVPDDGDEIDDLARAQHSSMQWRPGRTQSA